MPIVFILLLPSLTGFCCIRIALQVEEMETQAIGYAKRIVKLGRDIKHWGVWAHYKETVDSFKKTMPLVMDLRNPAMRPRHWSALMDAVGEQFDPEGEDFTLEKVNQPVWPLPTDSVPLSKHSLSFAQRTCGCASSSFVPRSRFRNPAFAPPRASFCITSIRLSASSFAARVDPPFGLTKSTRYLPLLVLHTELL